jgi:hypothetical protein
LQRDHRQLVGLILDLDLHAARVLAHPLEIDRRVRRVDDEEDFVRAAVDEQVVDRIAVAATEQRVADRTERNLGHEVRRDPVEELLAIRADDAHAAHVGEIEEPHLRAHGRDLVEDRTVLHGHVPAAELDHLGAEPDVLFVERSELHAGVDLGNEAGVQGLSPSRRGLNEKQGREGVALAPRLE